MSRHKFSNEQAHLTQWLPAGSIEVDPVVQRQLNQRWAEKIGTELDPDLIGIIHVSKRSNGQHFCIDGQHRLHAVRHVFGDNGTLIECKVYEQLSRAEEARIFVGLNDFRRPRRIEVFLKSVIAKDPTAVAIHKVVTDLGLTIEVAKGDRKITAIAAIEDVYFGFTDRRVHDRASHPLVKLSKTEKLLSKAQKESSTPPKPPTQPQPALLASTLTVIRDAWGGIADSWHGHIVSGIGRVLAARQRVLEMDDLIHKLATYPGGPGALVGAAKGRKAITGASASASLAETCIDVYNKGRRVGRVDPLR